MSDPYEVLQVHRNAEPEVIRAAYRALARKYHPDFGGDPGRMVAITEAWSVLGNAERRAAYDMQALKTHSRRAIDPKGTTSAVAQGGSTERSSPNRSGSGTVMDFGRYAGWTVGSLADHDPDYLEWLARTPIGRRLTGEIQEALARRATDKAAQERPYKPPKRRRSLTRHWPSTGSSPR
jgi:curved DNA-binding protein CbpA